MSNEKHTPTPWIFSQMHADDNYGIILNNDDMPQNKKARLLTEIAKVNLTIEEGKANAAFICLAVNNHDELVAALKAFIEWDDREKNAPPHNADENYFYRTMDLCRRAFENARTAIAKAEKGE